MLERVDADDVLEAIAQLALLANELLDALVEVAANEVLQTRAVTADHLRQEIAAHQRFAVGAFLFRDDLQQNTARNVLLRLAIQHDEVDALDDQRPYVGERDVTTLDRVIKSSIGILANHARSLRAFCAAGRSALRTPGGLFFLAFVVIR